MFGNSRNGGPRHTIIRWHVRESETVVSQKTAWTMFAVIELRNGTPRSVAVRGSRVYVQRLSTLLDGRTQWDGGPNDRRVDSVNIPFPDEDSNPKNVCKK